MKEIEEIKEMIKLIERNQGVENYEQLKHIRWAYSDPIGALKWVLDESTEEERYWICSRYSRKGCSY